jgi:hypothetical protein
MAICAGSPALMASLVTLRYTALVPAAGNITPSVRGGLTLQRVRSRSTTGPPDSPARAATYAARGGTHDTALARGFL